MRIAFFSDSRLEEYWDQLRIAFALEAVYEIGGPAKNDNPVTGWQVLDSVDDLPDIPKVMFNPVDSPTFPGTVELATFEHPSSDVIYLFGSDERHNDPFPVDTCVYIQMPSSNSVLWSFQAASIVLYDWYRRTGG